MKRILSLSIYLLAIAAFSSCWQETKSNTQIMQEQIIPDTVKTKMKIEIWSDVMCPFCYIGKRKIEKALAQFEGKDEIEIVWKSFQLSPNAVTQHDKNINQFLAEHKNISLAQAKQMNDYVTGMAAKEGLVYNFDKAIVANSFDAHRFSHFAKTKGLQHEAEEKLFAAYFTEGKNTADRNVLAQLGAELGMNPDEIKSMLETNAYANEVRADIAEANSLRVNGVPFFVFNRKYAISGAQDNQAFTDTLKKAFGEWKKN